MTTNTHSMKRGCPCIEKKLFRLVGVTPILGPLLGFGHSTILNGLVTDLCPE